MNKTEAKLLIQKYNEGRASDEEVKLLENWYIHESALQEAELPEEDYLRLNTEMWQNVQRGRALKQNRVLWPSVIAAAIVLICVGVGLYIYRQPQQEVSNEQSGVQDFAPGKNGATLILADGKRVVLNDAVEGTIAVQAGVSVKKTADGVLVYSADKTMTAPAVPMNTLTTARSEQYQVVLPDGSKVWLNAASSLKFPGSFAGQQNRRVELVGQAYFEVAKDNKHPFLVTAAGQTVEVLGTHFDVSSYPDEKTIKTTLLEGRVKVTAGGDDSAAEVVLQPNQQSVVDRDSRALSTSRVNVEAAVAWREGLFQFDDSDIQTVMRQLSRWYNIEVEFSGDIPEERFSGKVYRNMSLSKVLDVLSFSQINFKIQGRKMIIHPPKDNK